MDSLIPANDFDSFIEFGGQNIQVHAQVLATPWWTSA
jgi:hypothetical protein